MLTLVAIAERAIRLLALRRCRCCRQRYDYLRYHMMLPPPDAADITAIVLMSFFATAIFTELRHYANISRLAATHNMPPLR